MPHEDLLKSVLCVHRGNPYLYHLFVACLNVLPWWPMHRLWKMSKLKSLSSNTGGSQERNTRSVTCGGKASRSVWHWNSSLVHKQINRINLQSHMVEYAVFWTNKVTSMPTYCSEQLPVTGILLVFSRKFKSKFGRTLKLKEEIMIDFFFPAAFTGQLNHLNL